MGRKRQKYWEDPERQIIVGRFYVPKLRRIDLCTSDELDYKISKKGRVKRTDKEKENFLDALYDKTLKELLDPKIWTHLVNRFRRFYRTFLILIM